MDNKKKLDIGSPLDLCKMEKANVPNPLSFFDTTGPWASCLVRPVPTHCRRSLCGAGV